MDKSLNPKATHLVIMQRYHKDHKVLTGPKVRPNSYFQTNDLATQPAQAAATSPH